MSTLSTKRRALQSSDLPSIAVRWRAVLGYAAVLLCAVLLAPGAPGESADLAGAAQARAAFRYDRALAYYTLAESAMPRDPLPFCLAGQVLVLQREWKAAQTAYLGCIARDSGSPAGWLGLGDAAAGSGQNQTALTAWRQAAARGSTEALRRQGQLDESLGDLAGARRAWSSLPASDAEAQAHLGLLALSGGDFTTAARDFDAVRMPAHPSSQARQWSQWLAINGFLALSDARAPASAADDALAGYRFLAAGMPRLALGLLQRAVAGAPSDGEALAYLGWTEWLIGDAVQARAHISAAVRLAPDKSFCWYAAGEVAEAAGQTATAVDDFQQGLMRDARNPALWLEYGRVSLLRDDYVTAELALESAASLGDDPSYTAAFLSFYQTTHLGLDDGRARRAANEALQRWSDDAGIVLLCGEIYDLLGDSAAAYYAFVRARQLDPSQPGAWLWLGQYAGEEGLYVEAALDLRTALALQPDGPLAGQARALLAPLASVQV